MASYDAIIIGTGQAGPPLARQLAAADQRVVIIERSASAAGTGCDEVVA